MSSELVAESSAVVEKKQEGESLLLPLIQGILQNPKYHNLSARQLLSLNLSKTIAQTGSASSRMNNELNANERLGNDCLPIEDSGTESGEDLRLLAAGLQSNLSGMDLTDQAKEIEAQSPQAKGKNDDLAAGLLMEVTTALARLQNSINQGEIELEESKKTALLSLVNRLQQGLVSEKVPESAETESPVPLTLEDSSERRGSIGINRFAKRRNRNNRHTVGVTREELADARRIIEELEFIGMKNSNQNLVDKPKPKPAFIAVKPITAFSRQISEPVTLLRPSQFLPQGTIKQIEIPNRKNKILFKQSISLDQPVSILKNSQETSPKIDDKPTIFKKFSIQRNTSGSNNKFPINSHKDDAPTDESSSSDDEDEMVNTKFYTNNAASKFKAKENYLRNQQPVERSLNYSSGDETSTPGSRQPKYVSKKMKMKRANTVDLPKSYSFVNTFDLSDKDCSDNESRKPVYHNRFANAGLRTTITSGGSPSNLPPQFTPKTDNDKKFLAFIQKQNSSVTPSYVNPNDKNSTKTHNWTNKFGNLKTRFEGDELSMPAKPPAKATNIAASFWKGIEKEKPSAKVSPLPPVQPFMKELPLVSEKFPWKSNATEKIFKSDEQLVFKKKPMIESFVPKQKLAPELPRVFPEPNKLPVLKPSNVNNFSHAPMSAFKPPISRKLSNSFKPIQTNDEVIKKPLPQVSNGLVKQMAETSYNVNNNPVPQPRKIILSSPTRSIGDSTFVQITKYSEKPEVAQPVPWAGKPKSERVLSLAASKFENVPTVNLAATLHHSPPEPVVKYRTNPLYNGTFEKRSSLPPNASYASFDSTLYSKQGQSVNNVSAKPKETFTITDYTQPSLVSTYAFPEQKPARPTFDRQESLTNPEHEPLVLTASRSVYSPSDKPKAMELYDISTPNSSQISKDHSVGSICDLDNELTTIGMECNVAVSKVMRGPVAQVAYTQSSELTSLNGQEKENSMIKNLSDSLKKLSQKSPTPEKRQVDVKRLSQESSSSSLDFKASSPYKMSSNGESRLSQDSSNSSLDLKLPPLKIPIPAVPETSYSISYGSAPKIQVKSPSVDPPHHVIYNNTASHTNHAPYQSQGLQRARSSHMLAIPRPTDPAVPPQGMYGASQSMVAAKQKTVQSYFGPKRAESLSMKSGTSFVRPVTFNSPSQHSAVSRKISLYSKPVQKVTHQAPLYSLARSKTLPSMANVELLDESNIDDAFEALLSSTNL